MASRKVGTAAPERTRREAAHPGAREGIRSRLPPGLGDLERWTSRILAWIDVLVPPAIRARGGDELRRGRLCTVGVAVACLLLMSSAAIGASLGLRDGVSAVNLAFGLFFGGLPFLLRRISRTALLANAAIGAATLMLLLLWAGSGGTSIGALFSFATIPVMAMLLAGRRSGLLFTALCGVAILLPSLLPGEALRALTVPALVLSTRRVDTILLRDALWITTGVGAFSALYDAVREAAVRQAREAQRRAEASERRAHLSSERQALLVEVSRRIWLAEDMEEEVRRSLALAVGTAGADRCALTLTDPSGWNPSSRFIHVTDSVPPTLRRGVPREQLHRFGWAHQQLQTQRVIMVRVPDDLPTEARTEREILSERGTRAWLAFPVRAGRKALAVFSFERSISSRLWSREEIDHLRLLGELLAGALAQKRAEDALRHSEEKFSRAFAALPDGLVLASRSDLRVLECNDAFLKLVAGGRREEVLGARLDGLDLGLDPERREELASLLKAPAAVRQIELGTGGNGRSSRRLSITCAEVEVEDQPALLVSLQNVTERAELEAQLRQAQKIDAVGRLAGGIAHDFNNMLTVISGYAETLQDELQGGQRMAAREILRSAQRSSDLTRRLLAFSRRQLLQFRVVGVNALLRSAAALLRRILGENIFIELELDPTAGRVRVDPAQMEQAILNLAINARDAMPGGGLLRLASRAVQLGEEAARRHEVGPGSYARISVVDHGTGMDEQTAAQVLEPFFTTKPPGQGTGLGLSMAHGIVRQCGGSLFLYSVPGKGTTVELLLPRAAPSARSPRARTHPARPATRAQGRTILLVEDETMVRRLVRSVLEEAGHHVIEAVDGQEALSVEKAHDGPIDLLLSDLVMPHLGGLDLAGELTARRPGLRVAFMSGYPKGNRDGQLPEGTTLIAKPFRPEALREAVDELLRAT